MAERKNRQGLLLPLLLPLGLLVAIGLVLFGFSRVLLAISHNAATVVALVAAAAIVAIAAWVASRKRVTSASLFSMVAAATGVAMVAGGLAVVAAPLQHEGEGEGEGPAVVAIAAPEGAATEGFSTNALSAPSDQPFTMAFDNQDPGVQHNVVIYDGPDAEAAALFTGELTTGPIETDYAVEALPEGEYFFNCEVHPTTMTGTLTAAPGGEGGGGEGGGEGTTVVAADLAFDTELIELPADTPSPLTLDNQDPDVPHNIAIYTDDTLAQSLFVGDLVTGPASIDYEVPAIEAGQYYFHCDVHPDMSGTVEVTAGGGGGGGPPDEGGGEAPPDDGGGDTSEGTAAASIAAEGLAFSTDALSWAANTEVALTFDNRDPVDVTGAHNVAIYAGDEALFQGQLVDGPATVEYAVPPMEAGTYEFRCDIHPEMIGTVEVT
jgi:plastocyanin